MSPVASIARDRRIARLARRLDAMALEQLRTEVVRLAEENEHLRVQLVDAERTADFWWNESIDMLQRACEESGGTPGITQAGQLVVVPGAIA
ncbi:MAG TPA: hypothetical protein VGE09_06385 [Pseudoxanthomonas sp.]